MAAGLKGKAYILTGQETAQIKRAEDLVLLVIQTGEGALGTGAASEMELFGGLGGIVVGDLLDPLESLDEAGLGDVDSRLVHSTVEGAGGIPAQVPRPPWWTALALPRGSQEGCLWRVGT